MLLTPNSLIYAAAAYIEIDFYQVQTIHKSLQLNNNTGLIYPGPASGNGRN